MRVPPRIAALAAALLCTAAAGDEVPAREGPDCSEAAVASIQRRYDEIRDLRAEFVQTTRSLALGDTSPGRSSRGSVQFAKPGRMRWSYEEPEPSLLVSDGKTLWIYDPAHREVQRVAVGDGYFSGAAILFLLGEGDILRDFRVTARACGETLADLELVPRRDASYERLRVRADLRSGDLLRTEIVDLLGNSTIVDFADIRANLDPPRETFAFTPPEGVRVIELGAPAPR